MDSPLFVGALLADFTGFAALIVWMAVAHRRFVRHLQARHPGVWSEIQQPPPSAPPDPKEKRLSRGRARVTDYLYRREFRSLEDPVAQALGERAWTASMLFIGYLVAGTALMLALIGFAK